jgi:hypothetical protein
LYEILIDIVQNELPNSLPPQRGYEALIGMLHWVMPLDMERTLIVLFDTFYSKVGKICVPNIQTPEYIEFRTRYTSLLQGDSETNSSFAEHYPFDEALLRPLCVGDTASQERDAENDVAEGDEGAGLASKHGLLRDLVVKGEKKPMCHSFKATFSKKAAVKLVQIYFSDQCSALYKLDIIVSAGNKLIFQQSMNESSFARYVRYKRSG